MLGPSLDSQHHTEKVMSQRPIPVTDTGDNGFTKRKCLLWLIASEIPVCDWLALLPVT